MQLNKVLKGLLIAIPVIALTACSSTSGDKAAGNAGGSDDQTGNSSVQNGSNNNNVEVAVIEKVKSPKEIQEEKDAIIRQSQIIYFEFDKNTVDPQFNEMLAAHARYLVKNTGVKVNIQGHADERGTPEYNIALGERRAQSVEQVLTTLGVSKSQISTVSYGEEKPVDKSRTEAGFAKNRRAVLVY